MRWNVWVSLPRKPDFWDSRISGLRKRSSAGRTPRSSGLRRKSRDGARRCSSCRPSRTGIPIIAARRSWRGWPWPGPGGRSPPRSSRMSSYVGGSAGGPARRGMRAVGTRARGETEGNSAARLAAEAPPAFPASFRGRARRLHVRPARAVRGRRGTSVTSSPGDGRPVVLRRSKHAPCRCRPGRSASHFPGRRCVGFPERYDSTRRGDPSLHRPGSADVIGEVRAHGRGSWRVVTIASPALCHAEFRLAKLDLAWRRSLGFFDGWPWLSFGVEHAQAAPWVPQSSPAGSGERLVTAVES